MAIGYFLTPEPFHSESATSWQSSWEDWGTNKTLNFEGIHDRFQKDLTFRDKNNASWWTRWRRKISPIVCRKTSTLVTNQVGGSLSSQHIWKNRTDESPLRFHRSINKIAPTSPRFWRRATRTDSFLAVPEMASVVFFIQYMLVAVEWPLVELINFIEVKYLWARDMSGITEQGDLLRVTLWQDFFTFVVVRSFTAESNLLGGAHERAAYRTVRHVVQFLHKAAQKWHFALFFVCSQIVHSWQQSAATDGVREQHTSHVIFSQFCTTNVTHMRGSSRKYGVRTSHFMCHLHALMLCVLFSSTSPLSSLLAVYLVSYRLVFPPGHQFFIFHDVMDKFPVQFS